jgi:hypothetical protein
MQLQYQLHAQRESDSNSYKILTQRTDVQTHNIQNHVRIQKKNVQNHVKKKWKDPNKTIRKEGNKLRQCNNHTNQLVITSIVKKKIRITKSLVAQCALLIILVKDYINGTVQSVGL